MRTIIYLGYASAAQVLELNQVDVYRTGISSGRGVFDRVVAVFFPVGTRRRIPIDDNLIFYEFDLLPGRVTNRIVRTLRNVLRFTAYLLFLTMLTVRYRPALIEATEPYVRGLAALMVSRVTGVPYSVQGSRDFDADFENLGLVAAGQVFGSRNVAKRFERLVWRNADVVVVDRGYFDAYVRRQGANPRKVLRTRVVVHPAYYTEPTDRPDVRQALGLPDGLLVLHPGRLEPDKYVSDVAKAFLEVHRKLPRAFLVLAGYGHLETELRIAAAEAGIEDRFFFLGPVDAVRLSALMATADVIVSADMGLTLIEAMLSGTPVVTYDVGFHSEVVRDGITGHLAPFGSWHGLADRAVDVLGDPPAAKRVGVAARNVALEQHSLESVMAAYRAYFQRFLRDR